MKGEFTNDWFETTAKHVWDQYLPLDTRKVLEIGSYEGKVACYLMEPQPLGVRLDIHCIDTWEGSSEHSETDMKKVEERFHLNIKMALAASSHRVTAHKGRSAEILPQLLRNFVGYFDLIYVDGSHEAADVLSDAVMSFPLLRRGGILAFDDYLWAHQGFSPLQTPKIAIDSFTNCFARQLCFVRVEDHQVWVQKT